MRITVATKAGISLVYFIQTHYNFKILYNTIPPDNKFPLQTIMKDK